MIKDVIKRVKDMMEFNNKIKFNNEIIKNAIMDALDKMERGLEIDEVYRNELINLLLKCDRDFGIKKGNRKCTEEELQYSVYGLIFENYKSYIGQTKNIEERWRYNGKQYKGQVVYNAIEYYGWDNTSHIVICNGLTQKEANDMEVALISILKSTNRNEFGYNVSNGGDGVGQHSEETIEKIRKANTGKHRSEETIEKIRKANTGKRRSEESKEKMREAKKGKYEGKNNPFYNKHHSEESKEKMREAKKGKYPSEETIEKIRKAMKGKFVGGNSTSAKAVFCNEMIFLTMKEFAKFCNISTNTVSDWLNEKITNSKKLSKLLELGLRYATEEDINTYPLYIEKSENEINEIIEAMKGKNNNGSKKEVFFNGMIFESVTQFAKFCNVSCATMSNWLNGNYKTPSKKLSKLLKVGLRYATEEDINTYPLYIEEEQNQQNQ